jgi:hypothetical protein
MDEISPFFAMDSVEKMEIAAFRAKSPEPPMPKPLFCFLIHVRGHSRITILSAAIATRNITILTPTLPQKK